jgi:RNA polymerase sigma-70 factor, ECF subfamily
LALNRATILPDPGEFTRLLGAARTGDRDELGRLLTLFRPYLLSIADSEIGYELRAKTNSSDIVQDAFLEAQRALARFEGDSIEEFRAWLRAVLLHKLSDLQRYYRHSQKRAVTRENSMDASGDQGRLRDVVPSDDSTPSAAACRREEAQAVAEALNRMPDHYRQIIRWRNWEGLSFAEIGKRVGKSEDAARMLWTRAIEKLEDELKSPDDTSRN